jgi:RNA polymerase sigma factor (sigma-70 family)
MTEGEEPVPQAADLAVSQPRIAELDERFGLLRPRLLRIAGSLVGPEEADDVVHDTYLAARRRLPQLRVPDALEAWLTSITVNTAFSRHRRRKQLRHLLPQLHWSQERRPGRDLALRDLVEALPPRERTILVLHYGHGYRLEEIAALLDLTHTNVRTIIARTRKRLFIAWRESDR